MCMHAGVDSSVAAIELARANAALNGVPEVACAFERADAAAFMAAAAARGQVWDVVVLDPPKLAPSRRVLQAGTPGKITERL